MIPVAVRSWAAWAPGLEAAEAWQRWAAAPVELGEEGTPAASFLPAMLRRRCSPLARMMLTAAFECCPEAERADVVLIDGTLWRDDELADRGAADKTGTEMGHLAQSGDGGMVDRLAPLRARKILIHVNNTNPILDEDSPERAKLDAAGIEVAWDGMEIDL